MKKIILFISIFALFILSSCDSNKNASKPTNEINNHVIVDEGNETLDVEGNTEDKKEDEEEKKEDEESEDEKDVYDDDIPWGPLQ